MRYNIFRLRGFLENTGNRKEINKIPQNVRSYFRSYFCAEGGAGRINKGLKNGAFV